ncbi:3-methyl-2-oxobutanoate hydroxymethyltransferase [Phytophthora nicotianae]|uniref:3-methyl-2-oxobutanoate hydroxymethyltransferase n=1 Tax=Phytophthora nicotianae TaxID=4792 RepID=W2LW33_PHYNI|nr:3-methyl-2-oxobutanoate hydroxymethyltransferase [Phytophthora nicotianae]
MMRSVIAATRHPKALRRSHPAISTATQFSIEASFSSRSSVRTLKLLERHKVSTLDIGIFKRKKKPITMVTAYDYPSAVHVDLAGFDIVLVGDSMGMVELGMDTTLSVTLEEMIHHTKAVKRGATRPLVIADMPFGTCEGTPYEALKGAQLLVKVTSFSIFSKYISFYTIKRFLRVCTTQEGGADCVKIEGGKERAETIKTIVDGGIAVMAHIGLRPQHISFLGGFRAQGRTAAQARSIIEDALAVQMAGAFAVLIECVPIAVAQHVTELLKIPAIGIGAGASTDGQVLVFHDLLGMLQHPHHAQFVPKFCKRYAGIGEQIRIGLEAYRDDVESGQFSSEAYSPYKMSSEEIQKLQAMIAEEYNTRFKEEDKDGVALSEITKVY